MLCVLPYSNIFWGIVGQGFLDPSRSPCHIALVYILPEVQNPPDLVFSSMNDPALFYSFLSLLISSLFPEAHSLCLRPNPHEDGPFSPVPRLWCREISFRNYPWSCIPYRELRLAVRSTLEFRALFDQGLRIKTSLRGISL
jgi:hypothetical protein